MAASTAGMSLPDTNPASSAPPNSAASQSKAFSRSNVPKRSTCGPVRCPVNWLETGVDMCEITTMTIVHMSEKGQIVVPKHIRDEGRLGNGSAFVVLRSKSGNVTLRPVKAKPRLSLVESFQRFQGLQVPGMR